AATAATSVSAIIAGQTLTLVIPGAKAALLGAKLGAFATPIGAAIGAFAGFLIGGLVGSVFGGTPRSYADVTWDADAGTFAVTNVAARKGGSKAAARSLAGQAADVYNGVLAATGAVLVNAEDVRAGTFGMRKSEFVYWDTGARKKRLIDYRTDDAGALLAHGVHTGLSDMRLAGGDVYVKRALYNSLDLAGSSHAFNIEGLLGDLSIAGDYGRYRQDAGVIGALLAAEPDSAFAAGWTVTLARAWELGLTRRHEADWIGGHALLFREAGLDVAGAEFEVGPASERRIDVETLDGTPATISDTIDQAGVTEVTGTSSSETIDLRSGSYAGEDIAVAATVDAGAGNDTVHASDRGDTVLGGAGNDTLYGGRLDDWLLGGDGDDVLDAGPAGALGMSGGDGNYLSGGAGDDVLVSREGSDWLAGGAGADTLHGNGGDDVLDGGAGGDTVSGGSGDDTYVWRAGDGRDTVADEGVSYGNGSGQVASVDVAARYARAASLAVAADWTGDSPYVERARATDGPSTSSGRAVLHAAGGRDVLVLGEGLTLQHIALRRDGEDLLVTIVDPETGAALAGQEIRLVDWTDPFHRVEAIRFVDGSELELGSFASFTIGTAGDDFIVGTSGRDFVRGGDGNDVAYLLAGDDVGFGDAGDDFLAGGSGRDLITGGVGADRVLGGDDADVVTGGAGADQLFGQAGDDILAGEGGADVVAGGHGDDVIRYARGGGHDVVFDALDDNGWLTVWTSDGTYHNGHQWDPDAQTIVDADGNAILGGDDYARLVDYDWEDGVMRRHTTGETADAGTDTLEFAPGIRVADIQLERRGSDLVLGIGESGAEVGAFADLDDTITLVDWLADWGETGTPVEVFAFLNEGSLDTRGVDIWGGGTDGDDDIIGGADRDWLTGNAGDDTIDGLYGDDILNGNGGQDVLDGGRGDDVVYGGAGDDILKAGHGDDILIGGSGSDTVDYGAHQPYSASKIYLGASAFNEGVAAGDRYDGIENVVGTQNEDEIYGTDEDNVIEGGSYSDILWGGAGNDTYVYGEGALQHDKINEGAFTLDAAGTATAVEGDGGVDTIEFARVADISSLRGFWRGTDSADLKLNIPTGSITIIGHRDSSDSVEYLQFIDGLTVSLENVFFKFFGGAGHTGGAGDDLILGYNKNDTIHGNAGDDALGGNIGDDTLYGGAGDDHLDGGTGADVLDGGAHSVRDPASPELMVGDTARYVASNAGVTIDLAAGTASGGHADGDTLVDIESLVGAYEHGDVLLGDANANWLKGLGGDDTLHSRGGADVLDGGEGADTLHGGDGDDALRGDAGNDDLLGDGGNDLLYGGDGDDRLEGGAGDDQLAGDAGENIILAGAGNDEVFVSGARDTVDGGAGNDTYYIEGTGTHTISLGEGRDSLHFAESAARDLVFELIGDDLEISDTQRGTSVTLAGWASDKDALLRISSQDGTLSRFDLEAALTASAQLFWANLESLWQMTEVAEGYSDRALYIGANGADTLAPDAIFYGGAIFEDRGGDDHVSGTKHDDTFVLGAGDDRLVGNGG
ncbi:MAG: hypothetical protein AAGD40_04400, partial [Pseudomonadota bacterium]